MAEETTYNPHLIVPVGTQVVTLVEVRGRAGGHVCPRGAVGSRAHGLDEEFRLEYLPDLIARKLEGTEKSVLSEGDISFYRSEYERLRAVLEDACQASRLPEAPLCRTALNDLLIRLRLGCAPDNHKVGLSDR